MKPAGKWLLLLIGIGLAIWLGSRFFETDPEMIRNYILSYGIWAPAVYIGIYTIRPLVFFPASLLSLAGGLIFGPWLGTIYTIAGAVAGAVLSFTVAGKLGSRFFTKEQNGKTAKIQEQLEQNGFWYVLLFRLIPVINFDLISYLAAFAKVRPAAFALATLIGVIPGTFAYNFLGSSFAAGDPVVLLVGLGVFIVLTIVPIIIRKRWVNV
ncbi:TVP38/TMEM64 family protein [Planococcus beigongshangi]|uniref:TVP38/TMEM64 family protein n=1 Tax=Planococcus beigongshangi TaxID=2782536 RepID=UPI001EEF5B2F|nr:TVP38/TMEM64 family protein [Planococcus beigongshangi]